MSRSAALLRTTAPAPAAPAAGRLPAHVPAVQRSCAGCGFVQSEEDCLSCGETGALGPVQAKLTIGAPDDPLEKEADDVADRVMRMPADVGAPAIGAAGDEDKRLLRRKPMSGTGIVPARDFAARLAREPGGAALPAAARSFFEPRLGADLGHVRIHDGASSGALARDIGARAFTHRSDIYFASGAYDPASNVGRRLLAHELTHVFQQREGGPAVIRRQRPPAARPPTRVDLRPDRAIPVPNTGTRPLTATSDGTGVTWSLHTDSVAPAAGTAISRTGVITLGAAQGPGRIEVRATGATGDTPFATLRLSSVPTAVASTSLHGGPPAGNYGQAFNHVFTSASGTVSDLDGVAVGERFPAVPNPTGRVHVIPPSGNPFGIRFTFHTKTLTPSASDNWFLDSAGMLNGITGDEVFTDETSINVGRLVRSASNPRPSAAFPVGFTLDQHLFWHNPLAASNSWTQFAIVGHGRFLVNSGGTLTFETRVNGQTASDAYVGPGAVTGLAASPAQSSRSAGPPSRGAPAPAPQTVSLSCSTLPSPLNAGSFLAWTIPGGALGCTVAADPVDQTRAELTIGRRAGTVRVRVTESAGSNFDEIRVQIT